MRLNLSIRKGGKSRARVVLAPLAFLPLLLAGIPPRRAVAERKNAVLVERRVAAMGTLLDVAILSATRDRGLAASEEAIAEVRRVEDLLTTWRDGPLDRVNRAPMGIEVALEPELADLLATVFAWAERTGRAFDPTVAPLVRAWDLRGAGRVPSDEELAAALRATGLDRVVLDRGRRTIARRDPLAGIDEGAWGKGYALDRAALRFELSGASDARLDLGGQVLALGRDPDGRSWRVGVAHPRERGRPLVTLALADASVSTSGNSERALTVGGRRIGHLLDPLTGAPAEDFGSATAIAPSGLVADILSTAFFVAGPTRGLALSERLRAEGVPNEVLYLEDRGDLVQAEASPGVARMADSVDPAVRGLVPEILERRPDARR